MKTLAITGSSGSGKTTISEMFSKLEGTLVINADEIARDMSINDSAYIDEITIFFGEYILKNKNINRKLLASIIQNDENARVELNKITKKHIMPRFEKIISENTDKKLIIVDVPVLYENKIENFFDKILAVVSEQDDQIKRICERDNITLNEAKARLNIQHTNEFFEKKADYIIHNHNKTMEELYKAVFFVYIDMIKGE